MMNSQADFHYLLNSIEYQQTGNMIDSRRIISCVPDTNSTVTRHITVITLKVNLEVEDKLFDRCSITSAQGALGSDCFVKPT